MYFLQDSALIIYQNPDLKDVGLVRLTHILNGGVRIQYNPALCYVRNMVSIDWTKIVNEQNLQNIIIEGNQHENQCPRLCPKTCAKAPGGRSEKQKLCWNDKSCQIRK